MCKNHFLNGKKMGLMIKTATKRGKIQNWVRYSNTEAQNSRTVEMKSLLEKINYGAPTHLGRPTVGYLNPAQ